MHRRRLLTLAPALLALPALGTLAACGFKLRGTQTFALRSLYMDEASAGTVAGDLQRQLSRSDVRVTHDAAQMSSVDAILDVLQDARERAAVGSTATGQVREFQLRARFKFRLRSPQGDTLLPETELLLQRDVSYNESVALAKEAEISLMYRDMQQDMVQQVMRRLSTVRLP